MDDRPVRVADHGDAFFESPAGDEGAQAARRPFLVGWAEVLRVEEGHADVRLKEEDDGPLLEDRVLLKV